MGLVHTTNSKALMLDFVLYNPVDAGTETSLFSMGQGENASGLMSNRQANQFVTPGAHDAIIFFPASGNMSGDYSVHRTKAGA